MQSYRKLRKYVVQFVTFYYFCKQNIKMKRFIYILLLIILHCSTLSAQENGVFTDNLKSIQVNVNGEWGEPPVMLLGGSNYVEISFDDLQHNFVRYTYSITHCNADWKPSDLIRSEYMTGFDDNRIEDYEQSTSTEMDYNHFSFTLPNDDVKLLVSGNYIVNIFEDGDDEPVARACFSILESHVGLSMSVTNNTDIDTYQSHQQLSFSINYSGFQTRSAIDELIPVVRQNNRWDNAVYNLKPTYMRVNEMIYEHNRNLIFEAGNEYRRFEILDRHVPTMRVDRMFYDGDYYHATLLKDEQRTSYIFDRDQDGRYLVRNGDNVDNESESDYYYTHFCLEMPQIPGGDLYLNGDLTNNRIAPEYKMEYDIMDHAYKIVLPLKQGSYNYQYLFVRDGETQGSTIPSEGSFHQTENEYSVYVYHRPFGSRYDKLVGFKTISYAQ